jgi:hypothetical protein
MPALPKGPYPAAVVVDIDLDCGHPFFPSNVRGGPEDFLPDGLKDAPPIPVLNSLSAGLLFS